MATLTTAEIATAQARHCPTCLATPGQHCTTTSGARVSPSKTHRPRLTGRPATAPTAAPAEAPVEALDRPHRRTVARMGAYLVRVGGAGLTTVIEWHYVSYGTQVAAPAVREVLSGRRPTGARAAA